MNLCIVPKDSFGNERQIKKGQCVLTSKLNLILNKAPQSSKNIYLFLFCIIIVNTKLMLFVL